MKAKKAGPKTPAVLNDGYRTYGDYGGFKVTQEVFTNVGSGKMACLTTGETVDKQ